MQNVSEEFKTAIASPSPEFQSRITFPGLILDDVQIKAIELNSLLVSGDDFEIGTAPMDMVKVELVEDTGDEWGRNLLRNSNFQTGDLTGWLNWGTCQREIVEINGKYWVHLTQNDTEQWRGIRQIVNYFEKNTSFILSFTAFKTDLYEGGARVLFHQIGEDGNNPQPTSPIPLTTEPKRYTFSFTSTDLDKNSFLVMIGGEAGKPFDIYITDIKFEKGSVATPWTPAPEDYANYDYKNKECDIELGLILPDESVEYVSIGKFTVENAVRKNNTITLNCVDRMYKAEKDYVSDLMYPTTLGEILQSACDQAGIELATTTFANSDYIVPNEPVFEGVTCRKVFAQVAELAGGYAKINRLGQLEIVTLGNESVRDITKDHYFDLKINEVAEASIDKVIVKVGEETATEGDGENIYTIVDNMFVQNPNDVISPIFNVLKNVSYTACDVNFQGDFSLDLGDRISIDGDETYILDRKLKYTGGLREDYRAPAKSNVEKESTGKSNIILDMNNIKTQIKVIEGEISQTIEKIENLVVDAENRLYQSQTQIPFDFNQGTGTIQLYREAYHPYYKVVSDTNIDLSAAFPQSHYAEDLTGKEVTISLDVLVDVDRVVNIDGREFDVKGNRWTRIHVTKEFPENTTRNTRVRVPYSRQITRDKIIGNKLIDSLSTNINTIYYRNLQVQKGNVATRWTLTPEELEGNVNRLSSELKQLEDGISLLVRKNQDSGRFEVNADGIIAEINKTDGVGKVKSVKVTVDENGLTVDDGAVIIRDGQNTAIITSQGLKIMFIYTSSGDLSGWQRVGPWPEAGYLWNREAYITFRIPDKMTVTNAELITRSIPTHWTDWVEVPDGIYHARNLRLFIANSGTDGVIDFPAYSSYGVVMGEHGRTDITNEVWEGSWSPTGDGIREKIGNVTKYIENNKFQTFGVATTDAPTQNNRRYIGGVQFILVVEGYLRG